MDISKTPIGRQWESIGIKKHHGIAVPLFSLHTKNSCGIGEIPDLHPLIQFLKVVGMDTLQLLPMNDSGFDNSPYNALSSCAINPIYLGLTSLPFLDDTLKEALLPLKKLTHSKNVQWKKVRTLKMKWLHLYIKKNRDLIKKDPDFETFIQTTPWLNDYANFIALYEQNRWVSWWNWKIKKPKSSLVEEAIITQFLLDQQLRLVKQDATYNSILICGDIPILVSKNSVDAWADPKAYDFRYQVGTRSDAFNPNGQNWGFPLYNWKTIENEDWMHWRWRLETADRYYHLYRLDHIVGFFRVWVFPADHKGKAKYIPHKKVDWLKQGTKILNNIISMTSMVPIGEDLGTVPKEVRSEMRHLGIAGTKVMRWERSWRKVRNCYIPLVDYPILSLTTLSTHDTSMVAAWWEDEPEDSKLFAKNMGLTWKKRLDKPTHREILKLSHETPSLFTINLLNEYLALFPKMVRKNEKINIPGTTNPKNWSYRYIPSIDTLLKSDPLITMMQKLIR